VIARAAGIAGVVAAIVIVACAIGGAWLVEGDRSFPSAETTVQVLQGSGLADIGEQLQSAGVVRSARVLGLYVRLHGGASTIQAASYDFPAHLTVVQVAAILSAGGRPPIVWVTIPEGFTAAQIAARLAQAGLFSAKTFLRFARAQRPPLSGFQARASGLEGYLFPDTYQFRRTASPADVANTMTERFVAQLPHDYRSAARRQGYSVAQIVTIASMVEREAKIDSERPLIASVIYNRLHLGMPLEIDATIEYALPQYKPVLSFADLAVDSPYNTYKHTGLPPGPISNPGKPSLDAAFHPASTPYLYYVAEGNGHHAFSETLEEQQANERRYLH
jgi:UPF0755 protein